MYTLYYAPGTASLAVHWTLLETGAPHRLERVDFAARAQKSADYLKLNPAGVVPTLIVDGRAQSEAAALVMLLAERHPESRLAPAAQDASRADYLRHFFHCANVLQPAFRLWFYADEGAGADNAEATKREAKARIEACFDRFDAHFSDGRAHLLGSEFSAADIYFGMLTRWSRNMPKPATQWPNLAPYIARLRARPALIETHRREGLTDWIGG